MIERVRFQGYKLLRDVTLELSQLTVLVGPNACGKSSVLEGVDSLLQLRTTPPPIIGRLDHVFVGPRSLRQLVSLPDGDALTMSLTTAGSLKWTLAGRLGRDDLNHSLSLTCEERGREHLINATSEKRLGNNGDDVRLLSQLAVPIRTQLQSERMASPSYSNTVPPRLGTDGEGLALVLREFKELEDGRFDSIKAGLIRIVPSVRGIRARSADVTRTEATPLTIRDQTSMIREERTLVGARLELQMNPAGWVTADQVSEGTLLALGILTAIHETQGPRILLLDDLDKGLHPAAQIKLVEVLREILRDQSELQILATAHSPTLLAGLKDEEIIRMDLDDRGYARVLPHQGDTPGWMTGSELLDRYFGISRPALSAKVQRLALLAGDPTRNDKEDQEIAALQSTLSEAGLQTGIEVVPRERE